jgi:hypothetical protein
VEAVGVAHILSNNSTGNDAAAARDRRKKNYRSNHDFSHKKT